jgi:hypothetical protein
MEVVRVHDLGVELTDGACDLVGIDAAGQQTARSPPARQLAARALQQPHRMATTLEQGGDARDGALLAARCAIAVVK